MEVAEDEVRIGHCRVGAAAPVAGRTGIRPGAARPHPDRSRHVHGGDASAPRAHLGDVDHRNPEQVAAPADKPAADRDRGAHLVLGGPEHLAGLDNRRLGGRAAHVESDDVRVPRAAGELRRRDHAGGRARLDDGDRLADRRARGDEPAVRLHDQDRRRDLLRVEAFAQPLEVAPDERSDVGVHHRGARALELLDLRQHLMREGEVRIRQPGPQRLAHRALVGRVPIRVEETDRDGLDPLLRRDPIDDGRDILVVERSQHRPVPVHPLPDLEAQVTLHQRRGLLPAEVVGERNPDAAKLEHVPEPVRRDERGARAPPFQNRIRGDGGGVHDLAHPAGRCSFGTGPDSAGEVRGDPLGNCPRVVVRGRRHLQPVEAAVFAREDEVRERPPDVDSDPDHVLHSLPPTSQCPVPELATELTASTPSPPQPPGPFHAVA